MNILRKIVLLFTTSIMVFLTTNFLKDEGIEVDSTYQYQPQPSNVYYESLTENTGTTQREVINQVWFNMLKDNYQLVDLKSDDFYVDAIFSKDDDLWRYIYDVKSNYLIFLNNDYETSYTGITYINEGKENK